MNQTLAASRVATSRFPLIRRRLRLDLDHREGERRVCSPEVHRERSSRCSDCIALDVWNEVVLNACDDWYREIGKRPRGPGDSVIARVVPSDGEAAAFAWRTIGKHDSSDSHGTWWPLRACIAFCARYALWAGLIPGNQCLPASACRRLRRVEQRKHMLPLHLLGTDAARDDPVGGRNGGVRHARHE